MGLLSAKAISVAFHLPHIMFCLIPQNKTEQHNINAKYNAVLYYKMQYFPQTW